MPGVEVDPVLSTVESEPNRTFGCTAIDVIDGESLYLLGHD
jgi:hypothetical protein